MDSFKKLFDDKLRDRCEFFSSLKGEYMKKNICMLLMLGLCLK